MRWPFRLTENILIVKMTFGLFLVSEKVMPADFFTHYLNIPAHTVNGGACYDDLFC